MLTFSDIDDFKRKLRFYLDHAEARERIAAQGLQHVRANHTYDQMAATLIAAYDELAAAKE